LGQSQEVLWQIVADFDDAGKETVNLSFRLMRLLPSDPQFLTALFVFN